MDAPDLLKGKIAAIINEQSLVINIGTDKGVRRGMEFAVFGRTPPIADPDDPSKVLEGVWFEVARVQAVILYEHFSYCTKVVRRQNLLFDVWPVRTREEGELPVRNGERLLGGKLGIGVGNIVIQVPGTPKAEIESAPGPAALASEEGGALVLELTDEEVAELRRPIRGSGGFQSLLKRLCDSLEGNVLTLTPGVRADIERYVTQYGGGGFQGRLRRIADAVMRKA